MRAKRTSIQAGEVIDNRYRIQGALGRGGMGSVYRAEHIGIKRPVALKLLNKELRDYESINQRLAREAFATGRLRHENCVAISDSGTLGDGTTYLAMELLEGRSLGDELDEHGRLPLRVCLTIARHVLAGLEHAHGVGVVHRDLKPDNIFLVEKNDDSHFAKILDFGIAKLIGEAIEESGGEKLTQAGFAIGSPTYMSPEQATGSGIDGRTDLYSLSVVVYEMLTGHPPFEAEDKLDILRKHLVVDPPAMSAKAPDAHIPAAVEELVRAGLAKKCADRIQTAAAYSARIDALIADLDSGKTGAAGPPAPPVSTSANTLPASPSATAQQAGSSSTAAAPPPSPSVPSRHNPTAATELVIPTVHGPTSAPTTTAPALVRRRWIAAALAGSFVLIIVVMSFSRGESKRAEKPARTEAQVESSAPSLASVTSAAKPDHDDTEEEVAFGDDVLGGKSDGLEPFEQAISAGKGSRVSRRLAKMAVQQPNSPRVHYLLGRSYMQKRYWRDGFKAFARAIKLDPELREDRDLIKGAIRSLSSRSKPWLGIRFLIRHVGKPAIPYLLETVASGSDRQRENARRALDGIRASDG